MTTEKPTKDQIIAEIEQQAQEHGLGGAHGETRLVRQCEVESSFDAEAHNAGSGCYGLFQLAAATADELGVDRDDWRQNVAGGVRYMAQLLARYKDDWVSALAAYNWGMGHVDKCKARYGSYWRKWLPSETSDYVRKILGTA